MSRKDKVMMTLAIMFASTGLAATINYTGPGGDLADGANWSAPTWTASDTLVVATNYAQGADFPDGGLTLSADLPANAKFQFARFGAKTLKVDFGGHDLNTENLSLHRTHIDKERYNPVLATGGFTGVKKITWDNNSATLHLKDGRYVTDYGFMLNNWNAYFHVLSGAELVITNLSNSSTSGLSSMGIHNNASSAILNIDGGRIRIAKRNPKNDVNWVATSFSGSTDNPAKFTVKNGGEYVDDTTGPNDVFERKISVLFDGGSYIATNVTRVNRNTRWVGNGSTFAMTNGTLRIGQLYTGTYSIGYERGFENETGNNAINTKMTFHNSQVHFGFAPGVKNYSYSLNGTVNSPDGMILAPTSRLNSVKFSGERNSYRSGWFMLGGRTNSVEIAGGTFSVTNQMRFIDGTENTLTFSGGRAEIAKQISENASRKMLVRVEGDACVRFPNGLSLNGISNTLEVVGGSLWTDSFTMKLGGDGSRFTFTGGAVTGNVEFAANDTTVTIGDGVCHVGRREDDWHGAHSSLIFTSGKANQVLIISNGTYICEKPFCNVYESAANRSNAQYSEAIPFTNCPNSRIEFRGESPAFVMTSPKKYGTAGAEWQTFAIGQMLNPTTMNWTRSHFEIVNPVRLRYVMPEDGYEQAPFRNTYASRGGTVGGNAQFEFDMTSYKWPKNKARIPLIHDAGGFYGYGGKDPAYRNIDVEGLNITNAERLPSNPRGKKCHLELSDDGLTLQLVVPGMAGMVVLFR